MKKIINLIISVAFLSGLLTLPTSCKKSFLDEEVINAHNTADFLTTAGLDELVIGMYQSLKFHFNYTWAYTTTNYGVDEFTVGGDRTEQMFNSYDGTLNSFSSDVAAVWDNMYTNIHSANIVIKNVPQYYEGTNKNTRLGEGYFMRAFDYFKLVKQFGGVPLKLEPSETIQEEFTRNSTKEVYEVIIQDFTKAYELLPATAGETGRITKWAAAHFLAKAYLFRASELNNGWNSDTKTADLQHAVEYADLVINSGSHSLAANFSDLWNFTTVDGANETNKEIILAAQFSNNTTTQGRYGNQVHLYYPSIYQTLPGMQRDLAGGREFQRLRSTHYALDVYDRVNDSRFWKSFKTTYVCNKPTSAPKWTAANAPTPDLIGKFKFVGGEQSVLYIVNDAGDTRYTAINAAATTALPTDLARRAPNMYVRYFSGQSQSYLNAHGNYGVSQFVALSKFMDGSRNLVASAFGQRDGILARLAETYLIAAEAYGRMGQYARAIPYLNKVRDRAAYKEGENKEAYVDGGISYKTNPVTLATALSSYSDKNTYFESNNIPVNTKTTLNLMHLTSETDIFNSNKEFYDKIGASSQADKFLAFILNERSRELMGELMRWEDLARTKTLLARTAAFNAEAKPVDGKDYLRPIPQSFLDVIKINGGPLSSAQKAAMQNPGW